VVVIRAFIDESGTNPETPVLSVAGCYGQWSQWKKFRELWKPHSANFHALKSTALFGTLADAMEASEIKAMLVSVSKEKYRIYASTHFKTALGDAYAACALLCAAKICDEVTPTKVSFTLEAGRPNLDFVQGILESMMRSDEWCVSAVAKAKKEDFIELHCADFVSHIASSRDIPWTGKLFDLKILKHVHVTEEHLEGSSPLVTMLFQKAKTTRKALKRMKADPSEFENFNRTMHELISVPHSEIQAALEAERAKKKMKKRKAKRPSASGRAGNGGD
jgi:hypothetical protein